VIINSGTAVRSGWGHQRLQVLGGSSRLYLGVSLTLSSPGWLKAVKMVEWWDLHRCRRVGEIEVETPSCLQSRAVRGHRHRFQGMVASAGRQYWSESASGLKEIADSYPESVASGAPYPDDDSEDVAVEDSTTPDPPPIRPRMGSTRWEL
jgi:hypothetical protein